MSYLETIASLEPGDPIPPDEAAWLVGAFRRFLEMDGDIPLAQCFGLKPEPFRSAKSKRDYYLRRAFELFEPKKSRINSSAVSQFTAEVKAFDRHYRQFKRTGKMPRGRMNAFLCLAFDSGCMVSSKSQIRRIIQQQN